MNYAIKDWKPYYKNTLRGFFTMQLLDAGIEIRDCMLHEKNTGKWINLPAKPMVNPNGTAKIGENGKVKYVYVIEYYDKNKYDEMQEKVIKELEKIL